MDALTRRIQRCNKEMAKAKAAFLEYFKENPAAAIINAAIELQRIEATFTEREDGDEETKRAR